MVTPERLRMNGTTLALIYVGVLFAVTLGLLFSYQQSYQQLRQSIYHQCVDRVTYDARSQHARAVARDYWQTYIDTEARNRFIDAPLRAQRISQAQLMISSLNDVLNASVRGGCGQYR